MESQVNTLRRCVEAASIFLLALPAAGAPRETHAPQPVHLVFDAAMVPPAEAKPASPDGKKPQSGEPERGHEIWGQKRQNIDPVALSVVNIAAEDSASVATVAFTVELSLLGAAERRGLVREAIGRDLDPFDALASRGLPFMTILAAVHNIGTDPLTFNPQNILVVTDRPELFAPLDATRAYEALREAGFTPEDLLPDLQKVIFDGSPNLAPDQEISRILAYPLPRPPVRKARMDFSFFAVGPASFSFAVPMRPLPPEPAPPPAKP